MLNAFTCELAAGCTSGEDYVFTSGGAGVGSIVVSDSDVNPQTGITFGSVIIPLPDSPGPASPASLAVLALGGLIAGRRRR